MQKLGKGLILLLFFALPFQVHGQLIGAGDAAIAGLLEKIHADQAIHFVQSLYEMANNARDTYYQVQMMIEAEKQALNNLKGIADVRSFDDFMKWQNRQLYMERQVEDRFSNLGVTIGKETYGIAEIDQIPDALNQNFGDPYWDDFSEEQRRDMYYRLGLSPANYAYVQTWQERESRLAKWLLAQPEVLAAEQEEAAIRNERVIQDYTEENENLDINQISKESGITLSNIEMALRDQTRIMSQFYEYEISKDKEAKTPATPPRLSEHYFDSNWKPIVPRATGEYID